MDHSIRNEDDLISTYGSFFWKDFDSPNEIKFSDIIKKHGLEYSSCG